MSKKSLKEEEISTMPSSSKLRESYQNFLDRSGGHAEASTSAPPQMSNHSGYPVPIQCRIQYGGEYNSVRRNTPLRAKRNGRNIGGGMRPVSLPIYTIFDHYESDEDVQSGDFDVSDGKSGCCEKADEHGSKENSQTATTQSSTSSPSIREDAKETLDVEMEVTGGKSIVIKFPDLELSEEVVMGLHAHIETVYFTEPIGRRFCFAELESDADVDKVIDELKTISFGLGKLKAERKVEKEDKPKVYMLADSNTDMNHSQRLVQLKRKIEEQRRTTIENAKRQQMNYDDSDDETGDEDDDEEDEEEDDDDDDDDDEPEGNNMKIINDYRNKKNNRRDNNHKDGDDKSEEEGENDNTLDADGDENVSNRRVERVRIKRRNFDEVNEESEKENDGGEESDESSDNDESSDDESSDDESGSSDEDDDENDDDEEEEDSDDEDDEEIRPRPNVRENLNARNGKPGNRDANKRLNRLQSENTHVMRPCLR